MITDSCETSKYTGYKKLVNAQLSCPTGLKNLQQELALAFRQYSSQDEGLWQR